MALYRRGDTWWIDVTGPDGKRVRESAKTDDRKLAAKYEAKVKHGLFQLHQMGVAPDRPFSEAIDHFLRLKDREDLRTVSVYRQQLDWWLEEFSGVTLQKIDEGLIAQAITKKAGEPTRTGELPTNATLNRYLAALRACLRAAHDAKWTLRVPKFVEYGEPKERVRWLTADERARLLAACPDHWRGMVRLSLATGLRQANVRAMRWKWVDLEARTATIPGSEFKNGREFCLPLNGEAVAVLNENLGRHEEFVFAYAGRPITQISHASWKAVLVKAGIEDFRWHDLRHTWATDMTRRGVPTHALQKLGGWETMSMVTKYGHHDVESLRQFVEGGTSQPRHSDEKPKLRLVA